MIQRNNHKSYTFIVVSAPLYGHLFPTLKLAKALHLKGHKVYLATSDYMMSKIQKDYPYLETIPLKDTFLEIQKIKGAAYVPIKLLSDQWRDKLKEAALEIQPDAFILDLASSPLIELATELKTKAIINIATNIQNLTLLGSPTYKNTFSFFGITLIKPSLFQLLLQTLIPRLDSLISAICNCLVLTNSSFALEEPIALPANFKIVGLMFEDQKGEEFQPDLKEWLREREQERVRLIYVTFGSIVDLSQKFIDHVYYGLKKLNLGVLWSLKQGKLPEENPNFFVRKWLPQQELIKLKSVRVVISHCGWGGLTESINALKPILAVPVFADQPYNAQLIEKKGIGLILRKSDAAFTPHVMLDNPKFTHEQLEQKINQLIYDATIPAKMSKIKQISRRDGGFDRSCALIEEAVEIGYSHLIDKNLEATIHRNFYNTLKWVVVGGFAAGFAGLGFYYFKDSFVQRPQ